MSKISIPDKYCPELYDVHRMLDIQIVGEFESRLATFTNWILACQNVNLTGQRASGKTHVVDNVAKFLPEKNSLYNLSSGSEKSAWYQAEAIKRHSYIKIPELNKVPKPVLEILKDWGEGRDATYKVTIFEAGNRRVQEYKMPQKPFIFCIADEEELKLDDQLRSRLTVIRSDITESQNQAVNIQQAELAMMPTNPKPFVEGDWKNIREHISSLPEWDKEGYRHPAANIFVGCIPTVFTDCRRDFPKYLNNTYGIARFYHKDRLSTEIKMLNDNNVVINKVIYFVTPTDMYYNHIIYGNILVESSLRCSNMERQLINILDQSKEGLSRDMIQSRVRKIGMTISAQMITKHMRVLVDLGYVEVNKIGNAKATYTIGKLFKEFQFNINWSDVVAECRKNMKKYYPELADKYIKSYCTDPVVIHPYTGVKINLVDIKEEEVKEESLIADDGFTEADEEPITEVEEIEDDEPPNVEVEEIV